MFQLHMIHPEEIKQRRRRIVKASEEMTSNGNAYVGCEMVQNAINGYIEKCGSKNTALANT